MFDCLNRQSDMTNAHTDKQKWFWITVFATALWGFAHAFVRWVASPTLGRDDAIENIFTQSLELNYSPRQPPLYDWLLWGVHQFLPPALPSYLLIKYTLLVATVAIYYHLACHILRHPKQAALATLSLCLLFQIGWNHHIFITHTILLMLFIPLATLILLRIFETPKRHLYIAFGFVCGLGLLSKYGFALFVMTLLVAGIVHKPYRHAILSSKMLLSILIALAMLSPVLVWYTTQAPTSLVDMSVDNMQSTQETFLQNRWDGISQLLAGYVNFLLPLAVIVPLVYRTRTNHLTEHTKWIRTSIILGFVACLLAVIFFGFANFKERYLHVLLMLSPIAIFACFTQANSSKDKYMIACLIAFASISVIARAAILFTPSLCSKNCYELHPYEQLRPILLEQGFNPALDTLAGTTPFESGNLRVIFPDARVIDLSRPYYRPPQRKSAEQNCFVVQRERHQTNSANIVALPLNGSKGERVSFFLIEKDRKDCF